MRRYWTACFLILVGFLVLFLLFEALEIPLLSDPSPWLARGGAGAAAVGVGLLVVDVVLPVPSSVVMVAHGALFGVALGTLLSVVGSLGAALVAFGIGRRGGSLLARLVPADERRYADDLIERWGTLAIVVTRPVPLLAETVAVLAGASPLGWGRLTFATVAGSLPPALLYAWAGATSTSFESNALAFGLVIAIAAATGLAGRWQASRGVRGVA
jgi:uncharacterized membrane protein YdjX (TVP38/TMEM64 family)